MKQITRNKTFETNSSSTHTLTITHYDEISKLLIDVENILDDLDTLEELQEAICKLQIAQLLMSNDLREELHKKNETDD